MVERASVTHRYYCFGPFRLDAARQQLYRNEEPIALQRRLVRALQLLVEKPGSDLDKTYLISQLWPDTVVEEQNLSAIISMLRKVLGDEREPRKYILTNPGRGYRFVAEVTERGPDELRAGPPAQGSGTGSPTEERLRFTHRILPYLSLRLLIVAAGLLLPVALFGVYKWTKRNVTQSIAVLPFRALGTERDSGYLGLEIADGLIMRLRNIPHIVVRPTGDVAKYQGTAATEDPLALGRKLQVASLIDGTVERRDDQVWLQVKLLRVGDGATLWLDEYHGKFVEILRMEDQIGEQAT